MCEPFAMSSLMPAAVDPIVQRLARRGRGEGPEKSSARPLGRLE